MKSVGIIGGIGPESTVDYYQGIIRQYRLIVPGHPYPQIYIDSVNMTEMLSIIETRTPDDLVRFLAAEVRKLELCGADFAAIASNTPHFVMDELKRAVKLPLLSIVEETCAYAAKKQIRKVLLLGTKFTMRNTFYPDCFRRHGIEVVVPEGETIEEVHSAIFPELEDGIVVPEKKSKLLKYIQEVVNRKGIDGVVLGCTELPLMVQPEDVTVPVLNTAQIHIDAIVRNLVS